MVQPREGTRLRLMTTSVGSFPKPDYLKSARGQYASGKLSRGELTELERQATREVVELQESLGLDILVDGEMERGDMVVFFAEKMEGFARSGLVRSYGNRYYRKPIITGPARWKAPITVGMFEYAQSLTEKPVKGIVTGPYTVMDWSFDEYYPSREAAATALAEEIHKEVVALDRAGARYIQIDEPALSARPEDVELVIDSMSIVTEGIRARTISHICYGAFDAIYPRMLDIPVDHFDLEFANRRFGHLEVFRRNQFTKGISVGVVDVHSHVIEEQKQVEEWIERAVEAFGGTEIFIDPDCGLKTRTIDEAKEKLKVMVAATRNVERRLSLKQHGAQRSEDRPTSGKLSATASARGDFRNEQLDFGSRRGRRGSGGSSDNLGSEEGAEHLGAAARGGGFGSGESS